MTKPLVEFAGVSKDFGSKRAVDHLSFSLEPGEVFAFLGPNGAGKTTTIKMLCGLLLPTQGKIHFDNSNGSTQAKSQHWLSYVPDQPFVYEKLTGREFLELVRDLYSIPPATAAADLEKLVSIFELDSFIDDLAESYSHGMRQRLTLAGALLHRPRLLVLDEPMVGLDPKSVRMVKDLLRREAAAGMCVFMSTHTLTMAEEIADRVGILWRGQLLGCHSLKSLRAQLAGKQSLEDYFLEITGGLPQ